MKNKLFLIALAMTVSATVHAQKKGDIYGIKVPEVPLSKWNVKTKSVINDKDSRYILERNTKIEIIDSVKNGYVISIVNSKSDRREKSEAISRNNNAIKTHVVDSTDNYTYFYISKQDLLKSSVTGFVKDRLVSVDALVLPIKLRFSNKQGGEFDLTQSLSIGAAFSLAIDRWGDFNDRTAEFIFGLNVTNVAVDEKTVPGVITSKTTAFGLSPVMGFNLTYKKIGFGFLTGLDVLTGKTGRAWVYRKSPWFGLSIGTSLTGSSPK